MHPLNSKTPKKSLRLSCFFVCADIPDTISDFPDLMTVETYHSKDFALPNPCGGWDLQVPSPQVQGGNGQAMRSSSHHPVRARCNLDHLTSPPPSSKVTSPFNIYESDSKKSPKSSIFKCSFGWKQILLTERISFFSIDLVPPPQIIHFL